MKVVLYEAENKLFSVIYSFITRSKTAYPHGAIYNNGKLYDTTFLRGYFSEVIKIKESRTVAVCDIDGDCQEWIDNNLGAKYDLLGLILWLLGIHYEHKHYCFEVVQRSLLSIGIDLNIPKRINGSKIIDTLLDKGYKFELMQGREFNKRYLT